MKKKRSGKKHLAKVLPFYQVNTEFVWHKLKYIQILIAMRRLKKQAHNEGFMMSHKICDSQQIWHPHSDTTLDCVRCY